MQAKKDTIHPVDIYVGARLRAQRILKGLSQSDLARAAGITFQQIQKYEKGKNRVSASKLYEISKLLEVPFGFFLDGFVEGSASNGNTATKGMAENKQETFNSDEDKVVLDELMLRPETIKLLRAYYSIEDTEMRRHIREMIKATAKSGNFKSKV